MPNNNFQQFNPGTSNQESDSAYTADSLRSGGITVNAILPSPFLNKLFYQLSTMVAAIALFLNNLGFDATDASLATLATNLTNALTGPRLVASVTLTGQLASIASTLLYAVPATGAGMYWVVVDLINTVAGTGGTVQATVQAVSNGTSVVNMISPNLSLSSNAEVGLTPGGGSAGFPGGPVAFVSAASQNINYSVNVSGALGNPQYALRIRLFFIG